MKKICVFCGAHEGSNPIFKNEAEKLGKLFVENQVHLVYGGAKIGLMGAIANSVLQNQGEVTGVITELLNPIEGHTGLKNLKVVKDMHERKFTMYSMSDGFIIMPGGFGTMDEFFEVITWSQLNIHRKPIGILNINGYYENLILLFNRMMKEDFVAEKNRNLYFVADSAEVVLNNILKVI